MGYECQLKINSIGRYSLYKLPKDNHWHTVYDFDYHCSWNSLMPVVEKCYDLAWKDKSIYVPLRAIDATDFFHIERIHRLVVEFIKAYNSQTNYIKGTKCQKRNY
jgi:hypothetical protein